MSQKIMEQLAQAGQSLWLDYIDRPLLETGKLDALIRDGLRGMTSNPSIFHNAIGKSNDYDAAIKKMTAEGKSTLDIYDELTVRDIQDACDKFTSVYKLTNGLDGYVSLEINPKIAHKIDEQIKEGKRLYKKVNRPNVMIKVPSTNEGFPVIEELIASGINVNATLIFSVEQYRHVAQAYIKGLKRLAQSGGDVKKVHSVASVFVSRIDSAIDKTLDEKIQQNPSLKSELESLKGQAAVANARVVFSEFERLFNDQSFKSISGANVQRVLWASTGTKNPAYSDIKYVTEMIVAPTVNTLPEATLMGFIDHGRIVNDFLSKDKYYNDVIQHLTRQGIDINKVCAVLLDQGVKAFEDAFDALFKSMEEKSQVLTKS